MPEPEGGRILASGDAGDGSAGLGEREIKGLSLNIASRQSRKTVPRQGELVGYVVATDYAWSTIHSPEKTHLPITAFDSFRARKYYREAGLDVRKLDALVR